MGCFDDFDELLLANQSLLFQAKTRPTKKPGYGFSGPSFRVIKTIPRKYALVERQEYNTGF
jgi:hypothetical protein